LFLDFDIKQSVYPVAGIGYSSLENEIKRKESRRDKSCYWYEACR